ncbi:FAD-dependent oxidoreductase [Aureimonas altamirensis]|uniref:FAD-dependent oxidoreductase n=1 Tax=Aureimonas altamirensis TaxID=370622 RepID=UPI002037016F|nr:FAD-dependent oxidoreductase [Aureimonas altamirensis]
MRDVTIVGAGVCGLVAATAFTQAGFRVRLVEAAPGLGGDAASWLAGGMLAPHCEAEAASAAIVAPGLAAIDWWDGHGTSVSRNGTLVVDPGRGGAELRRFAGRTEGHETLEAEAIAALEPALDGRFRAALFFPDEAHLQPRVALAELEAGLRRRGASVEFGTAADPEQCGGGLVVDCRGARADVPGLRCVRGEMLLLRCPDVSLSRPVRILHPRWPVYIVPHGDGRFMVGASMIESEDRRGITLRSAVELMNAAYALHPAFADAELLEARSGLRPALADNMPRIVRNGSVLALAGAYRHGFLLAPDLAGQAVRLALQEGIAA